MIQIPSLEYDPSKINIQTIIQAIEDVGYKGTLSKLVISIENYPDQNTTQKFKMTASIIV